MKQVRRNQCWWCGSVLHKPRYYTVKDAVLRFKALLRQTEIRYKLIKISSTGSCYLELTYLKMKFLIRFADHHENNRKLPDYNVLVRYDINPKTVSNTGRHYYNEYQLHNLIEDIKSEGEKRNELKRMGKERSRIS